MMKNNNHTGKKTEHIITPSYVLRTIILFTGCFACSISIAQRDSSKRQTIDITSAYKPVIRNAAKINLSASPFTADSSRPKLAYDIPAMNLFFSYQPITLKPLALSQDSALQLGIRNYVKAGFGNLTTPYVDAGLSFGDGKKGMINLYGNYISSKGNIKNQDFSQIRLKATGNYFTGKNEAYGAFSIDQNEYFQYGYDHSLHTFLKDSLRRKYQDIGLLAGIRNVALNDYNINYDPHAEVHVFSRENKISESTLILDAPAESRFGDQVAFKVTGRADFTNLTNKTGSIDTKTSNNIFQVAPELVYYSNVFTFHGGVSPTWDNSKLNVLPNVYGEAQLQHNVLMIQAGWVGRIIKNTYRTLSETNPWMEDPSSLLNTKEVQYYGGVKATLGKHFSFNAKAAVIKFTNMPLFVNDFNDGKSFMVFNERKMTDLRIHGDLSFVSQDKFTLTSALDVNTYTGLADNKNAWHLIPLQVTGSFRWNAFKQLLLKGDIMAFSQIPVLLSSGDEKKLPAGTDLSAGAEFKITKQFSAWLDLNNIFDNKYQRWYNYPVYGLNVIGGLVYRF